MSHEMERVGDTQATEDVAHDVAGGGADAARGGAPARGRGTRESADPPPACAAGGQGLSVTPLPPISHHHLGVRNNVCVR